MALYVFKIVFFITSFISKAFSSAKFNASFNSLFEISYFFRFRKIVNYAGEFQRKKFSLIFGEMKD